MIIFFIRSLTHIYWFLAVLIFFLKSFSKTFDEFTHYGKFLPSTTNDSNRPAPFLYRIFQKYSVPEKLGWISFYSIGLITTCVCFIISPFLFHYVSFNHSSLIISVLFAVHFVRRIIECLFLQVFVDRRMNLFNLISGLSFYFFLALGNLVEFQHYISFSKIILGSLIFVVASFLQCYSHFVLFGIRKKNPRAKSKDSYYEIPQGGLFKFVSAPHYLCEILIYFSFLYLNRLRSINFFLCFVFVCANLTQRSFRIHNWYLNKFDNYPENRKKLIPFIL
ncbi:polyprenol reductase [Anaeramoeba flamelloides]|uniref:Polyprenol reductase n=1 Tax=Anaeramoeba flamelloides TaxID=1746091 RepID=A0AAV7YTQ3_9EUKA|nr:polyprenol reductase [Anaeramoeba flamelloides]